ncbi:MAG: hypothetical protein FJ312_06900 [SAR202 cluster bacterium]|nr:hypothetical protein [SAR202 cluster bacterium]
MQTMDGVQAVYDRREDELNRADTLATNTRLEMKRRNVDDAKTLRTQLQGAAEPTTVQAVHQQFLVFMDRLIEWLQLELDWLDQGNDAKRVAAYAMIPEINARDFGVSRDLADIQYQYQVTP